MEKKKFLSAKLKLTLELMNLVNSKKEFDYLIREKVRLLNALRVEDTGRGLERQTKAPLLYHNQLIERRCS